MRVFAFLNLRFPPVAWAVMRGMLVSASEANPTYPRGYISYMFAGMIKSQCNWRIFNEMIIERVREMRYLENTSRLSGMYFFRTRQEAEARVGDRRWPNYFTPENLLEFELSPSREPTVADANWITYIVRDSSGRIDPQETGWIENYWSGQAYEGREPVWELISNGVASVLNKDIRQRCENYVRMAFPESHISILMARIAGDVGTRGGLISPFIMRTEAGLGELTYLGSEAEFHDHKIIADMAKHPDSRLLYELMAERETWKSPDFTPYFQTFRFESHEVGSESNIPVISVHHSVPP